MNAADYNAWYDTPCGRRIGATEFGLIRRMLDLRTVQIGSVEERQQPPGAPTILGVPLAEL